MNPIAEENARPGTADWHLERPATAREIEGYAGACSVAAGETIALYVHTHEPGFTLEVFRVGCYAGLGARRVFGPVSVPGVAQPMPPMNAETGLVDCAWAESYRLTAADPHDGRAWTSGVHLARLTAAMSGAQSYIIFVVRDDVRTAPLRVQLPFTTYQAYNAWGGKSLYHWGSTERQRAAHVSFNRPYAANAQNPAAACGMGAGEFLTNLQPHSEAYPVSNAGWDVNTVRWLEREAFDLSYTTSLDTHAGPAGLPRAWLSIGHDEYWTRDMRDRAEALRDASVHLAFLGANDAYWQVRLEPSAASNTADRVMVCWKKAKRDPLFRTEPGRATDKWRSDAVGRPEEQLLGVMYQADPVNGDIVIAAAGHWVFEGTGLAPGNRLPGLLGYEVDGIQGLGPAAVEVLAASPWVTLAEPKREGVAHMVLHTAPSGAMVFATGSMQWAWGLDDHNAPAFRPVLASMAAQRITRNVLRRFLSTL